MRSNPLPVDDALPAAVHLAGPGSTPVLQTALEAVGGRLHTSRPAHIQYRPGSDVVVRFDSTVSWAGGEPVRETLMVSTSRHGAPAGTLPVVANADGNDLAVGVWKWPFDPVMPGLGAMVTPTQAADRLATVAREPLELAVVAYRPMERAVIRATDATGTVIYVKVMSPDRIPALVERHRLLRECGVPAPRIIASDATEGWLAMEELEGDTVRDRIKGAAGPWPAADQYLTLLENLRSIEVSGPPVPTRTSDALGHARMLGAVAPEMRSRIDRIVGELEPACERAVTRRSTVHGDLHEAQLILAEDRIVGLLDVDDLGPGDPLDDLATVLGHLRYREVTAVEGRQAAQVRCYADSLAHAFAPGVATLGGEPGDLDVVTAAVLVGLATGPFRIQQPKWRRDVRRLLECAEQHLAAASVARGSRP